MYEKENQKNEKRFLQKFKEIRSYDKDDYSDEAVWYRVLKQAAPKTVENRMLDKNLDCNFFLDLTLEIEGRNARKWTKFDL